jgi:uncharacterized damage-inducible protein DinB
MSAAVRTSAAVAAAATHASPVMALRERLDELMRLVLTLSVEAYCARTSRVSGSVGEHVRHVLDHVSALVSAGPSAVLSYDHRTRGTNLETEPGVAVREIMRLNAALERWGDGALDAPVAVTALMSTDGTSVNGWSTLGRELAFVMSHTVHHQAIVALLLEQQGSAMLDDRFGYAPSTPQRH